MVYWVTCSDGPSTSRSLASTLPVIVVSSGVVALSATATGASFTAVSTMPTEPLAVWPLSVTL